MTFTKQTKMANELRRSIVRAMTQLTLALEMDADEPDALLAVIETVGEHLDQTAQDYRVSREEASDESKLPNW